MVLTLRRNIENSHDLFNTCTYISIGFHICISGFARFGFGADPSTAYSSMLRREDLKKEKKERKTIELWHWVGWWWREQEFFIKAVEKEQTKGKI